MSLVLVDQPEGGKITINGPKGKVTVEAKTDLEVNSTAAKNIALGAARGFLGKAGISSQSGAYPVDAQGRQILNEALPPDHRYRQDFEIQEGL